MCSVQKCLVQPASWTHRQRENIFYYIFLPFAADFCHILLSSMSCQKESPFYACVCHEINLFYYRATYVMIGGSFLQFIDHLIIGPYDGRNQKCKPIIQTHSMCTLKACAHSRAFTHTHTHTHARARTRTHLLVDDQRDVVFVPVNQTWCPWRLTSQGVSKLASGYNTEFSCLMGTLVQMNHLFQSQSECVLFVCYPFRVARVIVLFDSC